MCVGIGVVAGGAVFLVSDDPPERTTGLYILGGMVALGLVLRRVFGSAED